MSRWKLMGALAALLALGIGAGIYWMSSRDAPMVAMERPGTPAAARATAETRQDAALAQPAVAEERAVNALPAWMAGSTSEPLAGNAASATGGAVQAQAERSAQMQAAMQKLQRLQAKGANLNPLEVESALGDLEKANGSTTLQGLRLDVLRENLRVAARMQKVAEELQALQRGGVKGGDGNGKDTAQRADFGRKLAELQSLQNQLRMDIQTGQPPVAARP